jgi:hypothetical protein
MKPLSILKIEAAGFSEIVVPIYSGVTSQKDII